MSCGRESPQQHNPKRDRRQEPTTDRMQNASNAAATTEANSKSARVRMRAPISYNTRASTHGSLGTALLRGRALARGTSHQPGKPKEVTHPADPRPKTEDPKPN